MASPENIVLTGRSRRAVERMAGSKRIRIQLDSDTDDTTRKIARAYGKAWNVVRGMTRDMSEYAAEQMHSGRGLSPRDIAKMDRVDRGLHTLERQVRSLGDYTGVTVTGAANRRVEHAVDAVLDHMVGITGIDRHFTKPSGAAMEGLILRSTGRIEATSRRLTAEQSAALKTSLFKGLVLGSNPRETAREVMRQTEGAFFGGQSRAETLARTELADAHRYANRLAYGESELVVGWKWLANLSNRTCPACWAMHNTFHEKTEMQFGHQNCRCTMVPVLADDDPADNDLGNPEEIFWKLPREDQLKIMGPGRLKALEAGVTFADLTHLKQSNAWRPAQHTTAVADLSGIAELNVATFPGDVISVPGLTNSSIMSYAFAQGGLTINTLTGDQPTSGYVVARDANSEVMDAREFFGPAGPTTVAAWLTAKGDLLDEPGAQMGLWYDTKNGKVVLDVVQVLEDRDAAVALGRAENQIAIFDLNTFSEIPTGGNGGYTDGGSSGPLTESLKAGRFAVADKPTDADVGRVVTIDKQGQLYTGRILTTSDGNISIKTDDDRVFTASAEQIVEFHTAPETRSRTEVAQREAKTIELQQQLYREHGIQARYTGADPSVAERMTTALDKVVEDWDGVKPTRISVEPTFNQTAYASTNTSFTGTGPKSRMSINPGFASTPGDWQRSMQDSENRRHFHNGTADDPAGYCIDHEFGHVLDHELFGDPRSPEGHEQRVEIMADVFNGLIEKYGLDVPAFDAKDSRRVMDAFTGRRPTVRRGGRPKPTVDMNLYVQGDLSGYAASSVGEMFAEALAVYRDHGPGESVAADRIVRAMVKAYERKFGRKPSERDLEELMSE